MNIALFGGTFDPIHRGHIVLAGAARDTFQLGRVLFVPANVPPHKKEQSLTAFAHRYAMIALATATEKAFVPSLLEAPVDFPVTPSAGKKTTAPVALPNYSID